MNPRHLIVVRRSPDWENFDYASSIPFMRELGFPENLIVDFATLWDAEFKISYREVRRRLKQIADGNRLRIKDVLVLKLEEIDLGKIGLTDWISFVDDDDWFSPELSHHIRKTPENVDGIYWDLVRLGKRFSQQSSVEAPNLLNYYPPGMHIWTNNYSVRGRALKRLGLVSLQEHSAAQYSFNLADFTSAHIAKFLACTVKHPCSTMSVKYHMQMPDIQVRLRDLVNQYRCGLKTLELSNNLLWMSIDVERLCDLLDRL